MQLRAAAHQPKRSAKIGGKFSDTVVQLACIGTRPQPAGGAAHQQRAAIVGDRETMSIHEVIAIRLRQPAAQRFEAAAAVARAIDDETPSFGTRRWSASAGANHAMSASPGCTATAKSKLDTGTLVTSCPCRRVVDRPPDTVVMLAPTAG
jgi:hypothetical protein